MQTLAIAAGGALGALTRYWVSTAVYAWLGRGFPWGTLSVNVIGSLLMGILYILLLERLTVSAELRAFLLVGFLGAMTTFSTFSLETVVLLQDADWFKAVVNILVSVVTCVLATLVGMAIARQF